MSGLEGLGDDQPAGLEEWPAPQFVLMAHLISHPRAGAAELTAATGCSLDELEDHIERLAEQGLVMGEVVSVDDVEQMAYTMTEIGRAAFSDQVALLRATITDAE